MGQCPEVNELIGFGNMETYLVYVDALQNSNKFWSAKVEDGNLTGRCCVNRQNGKFYSSPMFARRKRPAYEDESPVQS